MAASADTSRRRDARLLGGRPEHNGGTTHGGGVALRQFNQNGLLRAFHQRRLLFRRQGRELRGPVLAELESEVGDRSEHREPSGHPVVLDTRSAKRPSSVI